MTASIERRERRQQARGKDPLGSQPRLHVVLSKDGASAADSVNADMLKAGLARVKAGKTKQVAASMLRTHCTILWRFMLPLLATYGVLRMAVSNRQQIIALLTRSLRTARWAILKCSRFPAKDLCRCDACSACLFGVETLPGWLGPEHECGLFCMCYLWQGSSCIFVHCVSSAEGP